MGPPVVQHLRYMENFFGFFRTAENKVIVLGAVKFPAKSSGLPGQPRSHHKKVGDIIVGPQQIQVEIRFKVGLKVFRKIRGHLILVRVDRVRLRIRRQRFGNPEQGLRGQKIVVIQQPHKLAPGHLQSFVGISGDAQVFLKIFHPDPLISAGVPPKYLLHPILAAAGIDDAQLPMGIGLFLYRQDHLLQKPGRRPVSGYRHADQRGILPLFLPLPLQLFRRRLVFFKPGAIRNLLRLHPLAQTDPEFFWTVMFQIAQPFLYIVRLQFFQITKPGIFTHLAPPGQYWSNSYRAFTTAAASSRVRL